MRAKEKRTGFDFFDVIGIGVSGPHTRSTLKRLEMAS